MLQDVNYSVFQDVNYLAELFTSTSMWSLFGPAILITITYLATKKDHGLGLIWYLVTMLGGILFYMPMALIDDYFFWHLILIMFGGFLAFVLEYFN